jgi:uncharacterized protein Yka (UPF0111/DUF47 family)
MFFLKAFKGILVIGEKNIFKELSEIISISLETNALVKEMLNVNYDEQVLSTHMESVRGLEKKSDKVAFRIGEEVTGGAISPNIIDNLLECIQTADDIIDTYYYISRELNRMSETHSIDFKAHQEAGWASIYENLFNLAETSLRKLKKMLSLSDEAEIASLRKQIEAIEEQGDEVKDQGFDKLYRAAPKLPYLQFYHYSEVLHKSDDILDSCEDASQLIVSIVTSILK